VYRETLNEHRCPMLKAISTDPVLPESERLRLLVWWPFAVLQGVAEGRFEADDE